MRGYFLTNMYLSPIQCGIQSAHCIHDMFITYMRPGFEQGLELLKTWSADHKTMIVLNGGMSENLQDVHDYLMQHDMQYPFEVFHEPGIGNALTCVGVVLNENMIEGIQYARSYPRQESAPSVYTFTTTVHGFKYPDIEATLIGEDVSPTESAELKWSEAEWGLIKILATKPLA